MNPRPSLYLCALALAGCGGDPGTTSGTSGGQTAASTDDDSSGDPGTTSSGGATTDMSTGTGTSGPGTTTGTSGGETTDAPTTGPVATSGTGTSTGDPDTTGEPSGPAPDWELVDVNPNSATHEQSLGRSDYAGSVSGWYFAHAT